MLDINYIGVFLTFRCKMGCSYCLNHQGELAPRKEISGHEWIKILGEIHTREDLPISLQGGEPTMHPDFYDIVNALYMKDKRIDLLTNGEFDVSEFISLTIPDMFKRKAPYAPIRFSFHKNTKEEKLLATVLALQHCGYPVGIWGLGHPDMSARNEAMARMCKEAGIDFRLKEYLDSTHGTYKYPDAVTGWKNIVVSCYPSEMLFAPDGKLYHCHHFLHAGIKHEGVKCREYGRCHPCDIKRKFNRLQQKGHCSVEIKFS